jgi:uncharacterized iron-regulated protein
VLLGEKHDNPDHHRLQAWIVEQIAEGGRRPAVAFEMLAADVEDALSDYLRTSPDDASGLGTAVRWEKTGWPAWESYRPIADVALRYGLKIVPASLSKGEVRRIRKGGIEVLSQDLRSRTGLDEELSPEIAEDLAEEIREGHCRILPESAVGPMILVQRARDAHMANRLLEHDDEAGVVLIAGGGHVRRDRGVPSILERHVPADSVLTVGFLEVTRDKTSPDLPRAVGEDGVEFDLVWFSPRLDEVDPCERYRERLERARDERTEDGAAP